MPALLLALWFGVTLLVRRLHDMGFSGKYAVWIYALSVVSGLAGEAAPRSPLAVIAAALAFGVAVWTLVTRGEPGPNAHGPPPGTPSPPA